MHEPTNGSQPAPASPVTQGEVLAGKYRVDSVLGEGGMGVVVAATNLALGQRVAIKLLRPNALANEEAVGRFQREARAAASLRSEHVARALDVGTLPDGRPYMVLEYLEGRDLGAVIDDPAPTTVAQAVDYVLQACEAIAEAHTAGIVHRDLKPKNLFLTSTVDGRPLVKVLDFGISKIADRPEDMQLTRTTEVIGSPSYMSPEQLRSSRNVDARTDIWALGVILYELLTKQLPFRAMTVTELVAVVLMERESPVRALRPDVPDGLELVIARCLGKRPEDRYASVFELAAALAPYAAAASAAHRVLGVGAASGRSLPPAAASSSRVNVHGGTSIAWGETQIDPPKKAPGRAAVILGVAAALLVVGAAAGGGAIWYVRRASATEATSPSPPPSAVPLPPGRKDLPPLDPAPSAPEPSAQGGAPSALPSERTAPEPAPPPTASGKRPTTSRPAHPSHAGAAHPSAPPDDLSNIGRR